MKARTIGVAVLFGPALLVACNDRAPDPIGVQTVHLAVVGGADQGGAPHATHMTQEVTHTPVWSGDADGTGDAVLTINHGQQQVCYEVTVEDITLPATLSHIHHAPPGVRGGIVVGLVAPGANGKASGCVNNVSRALLRDILTNPRDYYVNVHTSDYPTGAVRGQLGH